MPNDGSSPFPKSLGYDDELAKFVNPDRIAADRTIQQERFAKAREAQQERQKRAEQANREALSHIGRQLQVYREQAAILRSVDCPECSSPTCAKAKGCTYLFDGDNSCHEIDDKPLCQWAPMRRQLQSDFLARRHRLFTAGVSNKEVVAILSAAATVEDALPTDRVKDEFYLRAPRQAARAAARFVADKTIRTMVLYGSKGTWKTWAARWCAANLDGALWVDAAQIRQVDNGAWATTFTKACKAPLLILNDIGVEHGNDFCRGEIMRILNTRDDGAVRTIVTCNLLMDVAEAKDRQARRWAKERKTNPTAAEPPLPDSIEALYGDRIVNRLKSKAGNAIVECIEGPSLRDVMGAA